MKPVPDMTYSGEELVWDGIKFDATSGMLGAQVASSQHLVDHGPIPEGTYTLLAKEVGVAKSVNGDLVNRPGIETLPPSPLLLEQWGNNRVSLQNVQINHPNARHRGGFYLHDSHKGFTHGCVEVNPKFFGKLRKLAAAGGRGVKLTLKVSYASDKTKTNGKTVK